ncbi:hypothetical protein, partial [Mycolicibacterium hodleri]|uniref:hypothetical protein n=1 Tax=Mycolicibacterium hodleri TaxID=49897 RepID=UPI0021F39FE5
PFVGGLAAHVVVASFGVMQILWGWGRRPRSGRARRTLDTSAACRAARSVTGSFPGRRSSAGGRAGPR